MLFETSNVNCSYHLRINIWSGSITVKVIVDAFQPNDWYSVMAKPVLEMYCGIKMNTTIQ